MFFLKTILLIFILDKLFFMKSSKLKLNIQSITQLTDEKMKQVEGGFTYSLSMGSTCQNSNAAYDALLAYHTNDPQGQMWGGGYWNQSTGTYIQLNFGDRPDNASECSQWTTVWNGMVAV
jgi:hypothetical protein